MGTIPTKWTQSAKTFNIYHIASYGIALPVHIMYRICHSRSFYYPNCSLNRQLERDYSAVNATPVFAVLIAQEGKL
jgi:nitrate reductase beta subunit